MGTCLKARQPRGGAAIPNLCGAHTSGEPGSGVSVVDSHTARSLVKEKGFSGSSLYVIESRHLAGSQVFTLTLWLRSSAVAAEDPVTTPTRCSPNLLEDATG